MRSAATALVVAACVASLFFYRDFETAFGRRFIAGYHTHHRTDPAIGAFDEPPTAVVSTHARSGWGGGGGVGRARAVRRAALRIAAFDLALG